MWSLPISPAAAIIYESIHSGALNGTVGTPAGVCTHDHAVASVVPPTLAAVGRLGPLRCVSVAVAAALIHALPHHDGAAAPCRRRLAAGR
eukprot:COSAG02_NODE_1170_length_14123_cov_9.614946_8_plen_90_part_00